MNITTPGATHVAMRSRDALLRWATALPAEEYWIAAIPAGETASHRVIHRRVWSLARLEGGLGWLRHLNTNHHHIIGRPVDPKHILIDDLTPEAAEHLARSHTLAAVVESSPGSVQAWISVAEERVEPEVAGVVANILATRFGGDRGAASGRQPGRLPGFTNRKKKHRSGTEGLYPYALLLRADGPCVDPAGSALLAEAREMLAAGYRRKPPSEPQPAFMVPRRRWGSCSAADEHAKAAARIAATLPDGAVIDRSRLDYAMACRALGRGLSRGETIALLLAGERALEMAPAAADAYAARTVEAALADVSRRFGMAPAG